MFGYILTLTTVACACAQQTSTVDPSVLQDIFGTPPPAATTQPSNQPGLETITIRPTDKPTSFVDKNGEVCQCVPYYLCDNNLIAIDGNNASVTGFGTLDIRFREDDCQESTERCCKNPKSEEEVVTPAPPAMLKPCGYRNPKGLDFTITGGTRYEFVDLNMMHSRFRDNRNPKGLDFTITGGTGKEAEFGEFPWVVAVLDSADTYIGVGVIIHPRAVLTGAHIVHKLPPTDIKIRAGEWDTQTVKERLKFQERSVQEAYIHRDFNQKNLKNDMALLLLQEPLEFAEHINALCMPNQDESFDRHIGCIANGWGKDSFGKEGRYAVILKKVEVAMVPRGRCNMQLQRTRLGNHFKLHHSFVCAGGEEGKDTCQGDGGAPLACPIGSDDRYKLTGLVAWGIGCGMKDVPAVYANVAWFRDWVDDQMLQWGLDTNVYNL